MWFLSPEGPEWSRFSSRNVPGGPIQMGLGNWFDRTMGTEPRVECFANRTRAASNLWHAVASQLIRLPLWQGASWSSECPGSSSGCCSWLLSVWRQHGLWCGTGPSECVAALTEGSDELGSLTLSSSQSEAHDCRTALKETVISCYYNTVMADNQTQT